ncbi:MAG: hypothetical protein CVU73_15375 [Deltaproteobacteria bacterium HGW-Deltaproteobacteria-8]|jgi:hypothetical protein|nr:MAG: hypothetical protein CVU73_15375 [Deltaproteobacteria bacterium HGW-Deltaproteobacteria-8]
MSEPIRSASVSPFAARPQLHSRRVSLRVGAFGLTYSTDRVLWNAAPASPTSDPQPVDPAPPIESERPEYPAATDTSPQDLEAARRQSLWAAVQEQAARQQTLEGQVTGRQALGQPADGQAAGAEQGVGAELGGSQAVSQVVGLATGSGPVAETQAKPDSAQSEKTQNDAALTNEPSGGQTLAQAMRRAIQAYQSCQSCFASTESMLQAVA